MRLQSVSAPSDLEFVEMRVANSKRIRLLESQAKRFPLPGGEGQGEGELLARSGTNWADISLYSRITAANFVLNSATSLSLAAFTSPSVKLRSAFRYVNA